MSSLRSKTFVWLVLAQLCLVAMSYSQNKPVSWTPQDLTDLANIEKTALSSSYGYEQLSYLTDSIGPRLTGSPQHQAAVEYVAGEMRKLGLEVTLEKAIVPHWTRGEERGELVSYPGQSKTLSQKIVLTALGHSVATPADGLTAEVVVVNDLDELHALGRERVAGKIVLFNREYDKRVRDAGYSFEGYGDAVRYRAIAPIEAVKLGAIATIVRSVGSAEFRLPHTGLTIYDPHLPKIPAAAVTAEDADLLARLTRRGPVRMKLVLQTETLAPVTGYNVIADLKGSQFPDQYVIVSGHLDSWDLGTGAIDDGAGVAIAMQAVQTIQQLKLHPKRTIRFVAWVDEEGGISGALQYAKDYPAASHFATIESDTAPAIPSALSPTAHHRLLKQCNPSRPFSRTWA